MSKRWKAILAGGQDNALLRFSLGSAYLQNAQAATAAEHLRKAIEFDSKYSAAWKLLAKALTQSGQTAQAKSAFEQGHRRGRTKRRYPGSQRNESVSPAPRNFQ